MSAAARRAATGEPDQLLVAACLAALLGGCDCKPDFEIVKHRGLRMLAVRQDSKCGHRRCPDGCRCAFCRAVDNEKPTQAGGAV